MKSENIRTLFNKYYILIFFIIAVFIITVTLFFNYHFYISYLHYLLSFHLSTDKNLFLEKYSKILYVLDNINFIAVRSDPSLLQSVIASAKENLKQDPNFKVKDVFFSFENSRNIVTSNSTISSIENAKKVDFLLDMKNSSDLLFLGPKKDSETGRNIITLLNPIYKDDRLIGVSGIDIYTETFKISKLQSHDPYGFLYIYTDNNKLISSNLKDTSFLKYLLNFKDLSNKDTVLFNGNTYFVDSVNPVGKIVLYILVPFKFTSFMSYTEILIIILVVFLIFVIMYFASKSLTNNIAHPLEKLKNISSSVKDNPSALDPKLLNKKTNIVEIDSLYNAFFSMIEHIRRKNEELEASYEELESVFEDLENAYTDLDDKNKQLLEKQIQIEKEHDELVKAYSEIEISNHSLKRSLKELKILSDISLDLVSYKNIKNLIKLAIEKLNLIFDVPFISVLSYNSKDDTLTVNTSIRSKNFSSNVPKKLKVGMGISGYSAMLKSMVVVSNTETDPRFVGPSLFKSEIAVPIMWEGEILGVLDLESDQYGSFDSKEAQEAVIRVANILGAAMKNSQLVDQLKSNFYETIKALADTIELKDPYTRGHSERVTYYSVKMAKEFGFSEEKVEKIKLAAILHDIGKIGVRGAVLNKPGKLTLEERKEIEKHAILGAKVLNEVAIMKDIAVLIKHHHEHYDGRGYPDGLKGEEIPIESRIISVADAFDAMTSDRPYRKSLGYQKALEILEFEAGKQFDPDIVKAFLKLFEEGKLKIVTNAGFDF